MRKLAQRADDVRRFDPRELPPGCWAGSRRGDSGVGLRSARGRPCGGVLPETLVCQGEAESRSALEPTQSQSSFDAGEDVAMVDEGANGIRKEDPILKDPTGFGVVVGEDAEDLPSIVVRGWHFGRLSVGWIGTNCAGSCGLGRWNRGMTQEAPSR